MCLTLLMFLAVNAVVHFSQSPIEYHEGKGWDGEAYYNMAVQFAQGEALTDRAPFVFRPGLPWLVAKFFPNDLIHGFFLLNVLANLISVILLWLFLQRFIKKGGVLLLLMAAFMIPWISPVRYIHFYPCYTDCWGMMMGLAGLLLLTDREGNPGFLRVLLGALVVGIGVLFREYVLLVGLIVPFVANPLKINQEESYIKTVFKAIKTLFGATSFGMGWGGMVHLLFQRENLSKVRLIYFLPFVAGCAGLYIAKQGVESMTNEFAFGYMAAQWLLFKSPFSYLHSWAMVVGPIIVLLLYFRKEVRALLAEDQYLWCFLLTGGLLGFIGGADTERFVFWLFPAILVLLGKLIENHSDLLKKPVMWVGIGIGQILSWRLVANIPQFEEGVKANPIPILGPYGEVNSLQLFSHHAELGFQFFSMVEYVVLIGFLYFMLDRYHRVQKRALEIEL